MMQKLPSFIYTRYRYQGKSKPEYLEFNAELQEFSQRVNYICCLQTNNKLSSESAYKKIEALVQKLEFSKNQLGIRELFPENESDNSEI